MEKTMNETQYKWALDRFQELSILKNSSKHEMLAAYSEMSLLLSLINRYEASNATHPENNAGKKSICTLPPALFDTMLGMWRDTINRMPESENKNTCMSTFKQFCTILGIDTEQVNR